MDATLNSICECALGFLAFAPRKELRLFIRVQLRLAITHPLKNVTHPLKNVGRFAVRPSYLLALSDEDEH
jgi:hypothetical protein